MNSVTLVTVQVDLAPLGDGLLGLAETLDNLVRALDRLIDQLAGVADLDLVEDIAPDARVQADEAEHAAEQLQLALAAVAVEEADLRHAVLGVGAVDVALPAEAQEVLGVAELGHIARSSLSREHRLEALLGQALHDVEVGMKR